MAIAEFIQPLLVDQTDRRRLTPAKVETFFDLINHFAIATPNKAALIDVSCCRTVTYAELASSVEDLALRLPAVGINEGDDVVVIMPRCERLVRLVLAVSRVGGRCVPYMSSLDIEAALATARRALNWPVFVCAKDRDAERLRQPNEKWLSLETLEAVESSRSITFNPTGDATLYCNETSGSTKNPKLVLATHNALLANTIACVHTFDITASDVHLCTFASHVHEVFARAFFTGGSAVVLHDSVAEAPLLFLRALIDHKVTCLMSNATTYTALTSLSHHRSQRFVLRLAESGGMPTPESLKRHVQSKFGATLAPVWGSTESGGVAIAPPAGEEMRPGSVGKAIGGYGAKVVDRKGRRVSPGTSGELIVTGQGVAPGYLSHGRESELSEGFQTGDRAKIDEDGWVFIQGRIGNEFKVAGVVVSADEIEAAICNSEHVKRVAVTAELHPLLGYSPVALAVPTDRSALIDPASERRTIRAVVATAEKHLNNPFLELPTSIKWLSTLPSTPAGKLDRRRLLDVYRDYPPGATKVRLPRRKQLQLAFRMLSRPGVVSLFMHRPFRSVLLVLKLLKGTKAK